MRHGGEGDTGWKPVPRGERRARAAPPKPVPRGGSAWTGRFTGASRSWRRVKGSPEHHTPSVEEVAHHDTNGQHGARGDAVRGSPRGEGRPGDRGADVEAAIGHVSMGGVGSDRDLARAARGGAAGPVAVRGAVGADVPDPGAVQQAREDRGA